MQMQKEHDQQLLEVNQKLALLEERVYHLLVCLHSSGIACRHIFHSLTGLSQTDIPKGLCLICQLRCHTLPLVSSICTVLSFW